MGITVPAQFEEGSFGDDAWIRAGSEVEEEVHQCYACKEDDGKCGVYFPIDTDHEDAEGHSDTQRAAVDIERPW